MRVWVVMVSRGEYSDRSDQVDSIWTTEAAAIEQARVCTAKVSWDHQSSWIEHYDLDTEDAASA